MTRQDRLFLILFLLVHFMLCISLYTTLQQFVSKRQVVDHHQMVVFYGMINYAKNEHELAAVIAHEFAHLELGHTQMDKHSIYLEYNADMASIYYLTRAGYSVCGAANLWERMHSRAIQLQPTTHPLRLSRAKYMRMPECKSAVLRDKPLTILDATRIYNNIAEHVEARIRFKTKFTVVFLPFVNAGVYTKMKEVE